VSQVPAGTGTFILASRRVEFTRNTWGDNNTLDIAVLSGLSIESDFNLWAPGHFNYGSSDIYIHGNTFNGGSGDMVDNGQPDQERRPLGAVVAGVYQYGTATQQVTQVEPVLWDGIDPAPRNETLSNPISLCFTGNTLPQGTRYAVVDFDLQGVTAKLGTRDVAGAWGETRRYAPNAAPFNCQGFSPRLALP
jgi:hypothetical protein